MARHAPDGETVAVHSVVVAPRLQRQGLATFMLRSYLRHVCAREEGVSRVVLISKPAKAALYARAGFECAGASPVVWGSERWDEYRQGVRASDRAAARRPIFLVDAFVDAARRGSGNPAGVVVTEERVEAEEAQAIATEMNQAETAFCNPRPDGTWDLRWFTPACEVDLCGHATLATAHVLWSEHFVPRMQHRVAFHTRSGVLFASQPRTGGAEGAESAACADADADADALLAIELDFPVEAPSPLPSEPGRAFPDGVPPRYAAGQPAPAAAGITREHVAEAVVAATGLDAADVLGVFANRMDVLVHLSPQAFLRIPSTLPALDRLAQLPGRGVIFTCAAGGPDSPPPLAGVHAASRCFFPRCAVDEDPVTGSAHCALLPFWRDRLPAHSDPVLRFRQCSRRSGVVLARLASDRAVLRGDARTFLRGHLLPHAS